MNHVYFCRPLASAVATQSIGRSDTAIHITRATYGQPTGGYTFSLGRDFDMVAHAVQGALTTESKSFCTEVGSLRLPSRAVTRIAFTGGAVLLTMHHGDRARVTRIEGEELLWLARAISDLQRFAFREGAQRHSKRATCTRHMDAEKRAST